MFLHSKRTFLYHRAMECSTFRRTVEQTPSNKFRTIVRKTKHLQEHRHIKRKMHDTVFFHDIFCVKDIALPRRLPNRPRNLSSEACF